KDRKPSLGAGAASPWVKVVILARTYHLFQQTSPESCGWTTGFPNSFWPGLGSAQARFFQLRNTVYRQPTLIFPRMDCMWVISLCVFLPRDTQNHSSSPDGGVLGIEEDYVSKNPIVSDADVDLSDSSIYHHGIRPNRPRSARRRSR